MKYSMEWSKNDYRILKNYVDDSIFVALERADNNKDWKAFINIFKKSPIDMYNHIELSEPVFGTYNFRNDKRTLMIVENELHRHNEHIENLDKERKYNQLFMTDCSECLKECKNTYGTLCRSCYKNRY